jgi:hypothetical protein
MRHSRLFLALLAFALAAPAVFSDGAYHLFLPSSFKYDAAISAAAGCESYFDKERSVIVSIKAYQHDYARAYDDKGIQNMLNGGIIADYHEAYPDGDGLDSIEAVPAEYARKILKADFATLATDDQETTAGVSNYLLLYKRPTTCVFVSIESDIESAFNDEKYLGALLYGVRLN